MLVSLNELKANFDQRLSMVAKWEEEDTKKLWNRLQTLIKIHNVDVVDLQIYYRQHRKDDIRETLRQTAREFSTPQSLDVQWLGSEYHEKVGTYYHSIIPNERLTFVIVYEVIEPH